MDILGTHLQESARRAAGSFLSPLTNAIGEQRRLVESLALVSKVRVEECKHMMVWSKAQVPKLMRHYNSAGSDSAKRDILTEAALLPFPLPLTRLMTLG